MLSKKIQSPEKMAMSVALASIAQRSHHRRDLEYIEELSRRHLDAEELLGRRNDDLLAECDFFDDLD